MAVDSPQGASAPSYSSSLLTQTPSEKAAVNPKTHLPAAFRVGNRETKPLVTVPELVQHLTFLACLHRLQQDVRECPTPDGTQLSGDIKWAAFCERAALRFEEWAKNQRSSLRVDLDGVDIDVLMVWHTYMLNPTDFEGDRWRLAFKIPDAFPLEEIVKRIDKATYVYQPHELVPVAPSENGETGFVPPPPAYETHARDLIEIHPVETKARIKCYYCRKTGNVPLVGTPRSPGYATTKMNSRCTNCFKYNTHEKLKIRRLCDDLVAANTGITCLAGVSDAKFRRWGPKLSQCLAQAAWFTDAIQVGDHMSWSFSGIRTYLLAQALKDRRLLPLRDPKYWGVRPKEFRKNMRASLAAIGKAYADTELFSSLNLAAATQRQASFISNMERIGWLDIGRWDRGEFYLLQKSAARYHAFLDLMCAHRGAFLSPTLDIDLAWHTHQLQGSKYVSETVSILGRLLNHDDKVADVRLKMAYDDTATLWARRFGVPYSGCGCPVAQNAERGLRQNHKRQFRQSTGMKFWKRAEKSRESVEIGKRYVEELLQELPEEERDAQCPSTHNMLRVQVDGSAAPKLRTLRERLGVREGAESDHTNPFTARYVFVPRRVKGSRTFGPPEPLAEGKREDREARRRRERDAQNDAFLYGYPLYWGVVPYGYGVYPMADPWYCDANHHASGAAGCAAGVGAASSGACVTGESGCAGAAGISACGTAAGGCAGGAAGGCAGGSGGGGCGGGGGGGGCGGGGGGGGGCGGGGGGGGC